MTTFTNQEKALLRQLYKYPPSRERDISNACLIIERLTVTSEDYVLTVKNLLQQWTQVTAQLNELQLDPKFGIKRFTADGEYTVDFGTERAGSTPSAGLVQRIKAIREQIFQIFEPHLLRPTSRIERS